MDKTFSFDEYPAPRNVEMMNQAMESSQKDSDMQAVTSFVRKWGLDNSIKPKELTKMINKHRFGYKDDLDKQNELTGIMNAAREDYKEIAEPEVAKLSWLKYRKELRIALYELADDIKKGE